MDQPGERWRYNTGSDVLGILIERAAGRPFDAFLRERLFEPLGMRDTGFHVPAEQRHRLPPCYVPDATGALALCDGVADSEWGAAPAHPARPGGHGSTVDDFHAFYRMLLHRGRHGDARILSRPSVELMTTDQLLPAERDGAEIFFGDRASWGFGVAVTTRRAGLPRIGQYGWTGGLGTTAFVDPAEGLIAILFTQTLMTSPVAPPVFQDFTTTAYGAIEG
jgi:CubicO group peptidase (beta-lactamase class C family)